MNFATFNLKLLGTLAFSFLLESNSLNAMDQNNENNQSMGIVNDPQGIKWETAISKVEIKEAVQNFLKVLAKQINKENNYLKEKIQPNTWEKIIGQFPPNAFKWNQFKKSPMKITLKNNEKISLYIGEDFIDKYQKRISKSLEKFDLCKDTQDKTCFANKIYHFDSQLKKMIPVEMAFWKDGDHNVMLIPIRIQLDENKKTFGAQEWEHLAVMFVAVNVDGHFEECKKINKEKNKEDFEEHLCIFKKEMKDFGKNNPHDKDDKN